MLSLSVSQNFSFTEIKRTGERSGQTGAVSLYLADPKQHLNACVLSHSVVSDPL